MLSPDLVFASAGFRMIHHVTRVVPRSALDDCIVFYGILGFREVEVPPGLAGRATWLQADGPRATSQVHLMPSPDSEPDEGHFAIVARSYEETVARLREAGHAVDPRREHWGSPRAFVRDPAGNVVELMAWPPGELPPQPPREPPPRPKQ